MKTQLPYEYYVLPFCHKGVNLKAQDALNLGEVLRGTRIYETPYKFNMAESAVANHPLFPVCVFLARTASPHNSAAAVRLPCLPNRDLHCC